MTDPAPSTQDSPQETVQQPAPQPAPQPAHQSNTPGPGQRLLDAIDALPDKLVQAIQEATPKQTKVTPAPAPAKETASSTKDTPTTPAPNNVNAGAGDRFRKWWFSG